MDKPRRRYSKWNKPDREKQVELIETESRIMITRCQEVGKWGDAGQRLQALIYQMNEFLDLISNVVIIVNNTVLYT